METSGIIEHLNKLVKLHELLYGIVCKKTEALKKEDLPTINRLMNDEQKFMKAIEQIEVSRKREVSAFLSLHRMEQSDNFEDLLSLVTEDEKKVLLAKREQLLSIVSSLKKQADLNKQLINQSLRYINVSLDLMRPKQRQQEQYNYDNPTNTPAYQSAQSGRFEWKA